MSDRVAGLTICAVGTSMPEVFVSLNNTSGGTSGRAVGNVMRCDITNLLLILGAPALFAPVAFNPAHNLDLALIAIFAVCMVIFTFVGRRRTAPRRSRIHAKKRLAVLNRTARRFSIMLTGAQALTS